MTATKLTPRPALGRALFYTRDSAGKSDLSAIQHAAWAARKAASLSLAFDGNAEEAEKMLAEECPVRGDLFVDFGTPGNEMSRPALDAFLARARADRTVSHVLIPRRDRLARPHNPDDGTRLEVRLRQAGLTVLLMDGTVLAPMGPNARLELGERIGSPIAYETAGAFRRELAHRILLAKVGLANAGFSIGGEPPYGFCRWLSSDDGIPMRALLRGETVELPGHHVVWLPDPARMPILERILQRIRTRNPSRIAADLNDDGVPAPFAGRTWNRGGRVVELGGLWEGRTVARIATHPALLGLMEYGASSSGGELRFAADGPRELTLDDYGPGDAPRTVIDPRSRVIVAPVPVDRPPVPSEREHAEIVGIVAGRSPSRRGQRRCRGDGPNPLGSRVFDGNCGWPMYRYQKRNRWGYRCGLNERTQSKCCRHNAIDGRHLTGLVLAAVRRKLLAPGETDRLVSRVREIASSEGVGAGESADRASLEAESARLEADPARVAVNMALASSGEVRVAMEEVFGRLRRDKSRVEGLIRSLPALPDVREVSAAVDRATAEVRRLTTLVASVGSDDWKALAELFAALNVRVRLSFSRTTKGRLVRDIPDAGELTLGDTPWFNGLYTGPTGKAAVRKRIADGQSVTGSPHRCGEDGIVVGTEVEWSGIQPRVTTLSPACSIVRSPNPKPSGRMSDPM